MVKYVLALISTFVAAWMLIGGATSASAHRYYPGCNCGPVAPTTHYKIEHPMKFATHYHDVSVVKHVQRVHRVTTITEVQPIIHIHDITRVHHHTIVSTVNAYHHMTEHLTPIRFVQHSVQNYYDCHCGQ